MTLYLTSIMPMEVETIYSRFGWVDTLMIQQALNVFMQTNGNLFKMAQLQTQLKVKVPIGPKLQHFMDPNDWSWIYGDNWINVGLNPSKVAVESFIEDNYGGDWYYPG